MLYAGMLSMTGTRPHRRVSLTSATLEWEASEGPPADFRWPACLLQRFATVHPPGITPAGKTFAHYPSADERSVRTDPGLSTGRAAIYITAGRPEERDPLGIPGIVDRLAGMLAASSAYSPIEASFSGAASAREDFWLSFNPTRRPVRTHGLKTPRSPRRHPPETP